MMGMGMGVGLGRRSRFATRALTLVGYAGSSSGNPTLPEHQAGDLIVVAASANTSATLPTATDYTLLGEGASGNSCALAFLTRTAPGPGTTVSLTGASGTRSVWIFRNAQVSDQAYVNLPTGTTMTWPALSNMGGADSFVCGYIMSRAAQTNIATAVAAAATGLNTTRGSTSGTTPSRWIGDTTAVTRTTFPGYAGTFDSTTSGSCCGVFSVKFL